MPDFETHPLGTHHEIVLSRELAKAIEQLITQYGEGIIPHQLSIPYNNLKEHYENHKRPNS